MGDEFRQNSLACLSKSTTNWPGLPGEGDLSDPLRYRNRPSESKERALSPLEQSVTHALAHWNVGFNTQNRKPMLALTLTSGEKFAVQMAAQTALELSSALKIEVERTLPLAGSKRN
jgi:hypothetical protein